MAKIEGQLLDNNAVKILKKKSMQTQDLTNIIKSTLNQSPDISTMCTYTKQTHPHYGISTNIILH
jgi:hypothetical protein